MKKGIIGLALGLFIGLSFSFAGNVWAAVKQYVLTEVTYPVLVDGKAYKDANAPILNYNGSTYIPLAKVGDLTGVKYTWNAQKRQVEISRNVGEPSGPIIGYEGQPEPTLPGGGVLQPETDVPGYQVPGYKGHADTLDVNIELAKIEGQPQPPLLSQGWIKEELTQRVWGLGQFFGAGEDAYSINFDEVKFARNYDILHTFKFPAGWSDQKFGETVVDGVRVKRHMNHNYYNIADVERLLKL